jgi:hypothetical protein
MISDGADRPPHNRVGGDEGFDHLTTRRETGGLASSERQRSVALQCHNLHAAFGTGYQTGSVACAPDGSRSIGQSVGHHDVITGAHGEVGVFRERIESHGSQVQLGRILGIVAENDLGERSNLDLASLADRQCRPAVLVCCN